MFLTCWRTSRRARSRKFCRMIVVIWEKKFSLKNDETESKNDDDKNVSKMLKIMTAIDWLSIKNTLRDNHKCAELNSISRTETSVETKTEIKSWMISNTTTTNDSAKLWFEMLRFLKLKTLIDESKRFDWKKTCLFTNNALFNSKCLVSKIKRIRNLIDFSWIFALLILIISTRVIWACFVSLTTLLLETRWKFVNVRSSLENIAINLRLSFDETSCETTLNKMIICRFCSFNYVIIVC